MTLLAVHPGVADFCIKFAQNDYFVEIRKEPITQDMTKLVLVDWMDENESDKLTQALGGINLCYMAFLLGDLSL